MNLTALQKRLLNDFQRDFPLQPRPYLALAERLGVSEATVIATLSRLQDEGKISRIGPVFQPHRAGISTLAAIAAPAMTTMSARSRREPAGGGVPVAAPTKVRYGRTPMANSSLTPSVSTLAWNARWRSSHVRSMRRRLLGCPLMGRLVPDSDPCR